MRFLKFVGGVLLVFLAVLLILPALMKDSAETSQSIVVNAKAKTVFRQVNKLENWKNWSPFQLDDPKMQSVFEGPEFGVGSKHNWTSEEVGSGGMTITRSEPYTFIQNVLDMKGSGIAFDEWTFETLPEGVKVTWTLKLSGLKYPFHRYFGYYIESTMKPIQERGLAKLKEVAEASAEAPVVEEIELEAQQAMAIYDSAMMTDMGAVMAQNFEMLQKRIRGQASGVPFAVYYNWSDNAPIHFRVAVPVAEEMRESGVVTSYERPAGKALKAVCKGNYDGLAALHNEMDLYMAEHHLKLRGKGVYEEYVVGPADSPDSNDWITFVVYPVADSLQP